MRVAISKNCTLDIWSLFSADPGDESSELPWSMNAIASSIQHVLEAERDPDAYDWVRVSYPEGGDRMILAWRPQNCSECEEAEDFSCGWCSKHTWHIEEGNGVEARNQAMKHGVPSWIVKAMDALNNGTLNVGVTNHQN